MQLVTDIGAYGDEMLELEYTASEAYHCFVYGSRERSDAIRQYLFERGVSELSAPHGRALVDDGRVVGVLASLSRDELNTCRLQAAVALREADWFMRDVDVRRRIALAGKTLMKVEEHDQYLSRIAVASHARQRGLGGWLLDRFEEEAVQAGRRRLVLEVSATSEPAIRLYRRHRYDEVAVRRVDDPESGRTLEHVHMVKTLASDPSGVSLR
jgi:ribosomal protein S18 acetylase RimI-like enzyme